MPRTYLIFQIHIVLFACSYFSSLKHLFGSLLNDSKGKSLFTIIPFDDSLLRAGVLHNVAQGSPKLLSMEYFFKVVTFSTKAPL